MPALGGAGTQGEDPGPTGAETSLKGLNVEFRYELFLASQLLAFLPVIYFIHPTKAVRVFPTCQATTVQACLREGVALRPEATWRGRAASVLLIPRPPPSSS